MPLFRKLPVVIEAIRFNGHNLADCGLKIAAGESTPHIDTLEGRMFALHGDWIITGFKGEKYPCKPDIFAVTYEPVESSPKG